MRFPGPLDFAFLAVLALLFTMYYVFTAPTDISPFRKRDNSCKYNGCTCSVGSPQGEYCWRCGSTSIGVRNAGNTSVWDSDWHSWVFECNPQGGCCAYGLRFSCEAGAGTPVSPCGPKKTT
ncbi:hypothetical protein BDD12DRAFT_864549 [Trichophaea hybrida]|nr:hypothetical protein BDD12DRAFT_864549 [Trichophaea hybrida]